VSLARFVFVTLVAWIERFTCILMCFVSQNYGRVRGIRTCLTTPTNQNRADSADAAENLTQALPGDGTSRSLTC
jgi:hypothetical protein